MKIKKYLAVIFICLVACFILCPMGSEKVSAAKKTVNHNKPLQVGEFMEPVEGYSFKPSEDAYTLTTDRFILKVAPGLYVSEDFVNTINEMMDIIEDTTGCSFYPKNSFANKYLTSNQKLVINLKFREMTAGGLTIECASADEVIFMEDEAVNGDLTDSYSTMIHELLHVIQLRNYGTLGDIVTEGYAESYTGTIEKILKQKYGNKVRTDERNNEIACISVYGRNECNLDVDYNVDWVTSDNIEKYFFLEPGHGGHEPSYWIIEYIREKYGDDGLKNLMEALGKRWEKYVTKERTDSNIVFPNSIELEVIKNTLSKKFVKQFYDWFKKQDFTETYAILDLTGVDRYEIPISTTTAYNEIPWMGYPNSFSYKGTLELDYSRSFAFLQQQYGYNIKGISGYFSGIGRVDFYDQYGTRLYGFGEEDQFSNKSVKVPYATKFVITGPDSATEYYIYGLDGEGEFDDVVFDNVECKDGRKVTFTEIKKIEHKSADDTQNDSTAGDFGDSGSGVVEDTNKPINRKVKNLKQLKQALADSMYRGGKITITANINIQNDGIVISPNTKVVIKSGKKLTLKKESYIDIQGSLSGNAKSIVFSGGWLWLNESASWKIGKYTFTSKVRADFSYDMGYGCGIRIEKEKGKYKVMFGLYNRLYVTAPKGTKVENLVCFNQIRDKFSMYLNKQKVTAKKIKKLTVF